MEAGRVRCSSRHTYISEILSLPYGWRLSGTAGRSGVCERISSLYIRCRHRRAQWFRGLRRSRCSLWRCRLLQRLGLSGHWQGWIPLRVDQTVDRTGSQNMRANCEDRRHQELYLSSICSCPNSISMFESLLPSRLDSITYPATVMGST